VADIRRLRTKQHAIRLAMRTSKIDPLKTPMTIRSVFEDDNGPEELDEEHDADGTTEIELVPDGFDMPIEVNRVAGNDTTDGCCGNASGRSPASWANPVSK